MTGKKKKDQRPWQAVGLRLWAARLGIQRTVKDKPEIKADWAWAKTQTSFAKTVGSYRQQLSRYEKGYDPVSLPVLINIRNRTGVPTDWVLVGLTEMIPGIFRENILKCYESLLRGDPDC